MANIPLKAVQQQLSMVRGFIVTAKFVPLDPDGSIHDCTAATDFAMTFQTTLAYNAQSPTLNPATVTGDATGVTITCNAADVDSLISSFGPNLNGTYVGVLVEAGDSGNAVYGNWSILNTLTP